MILFSKTYVFSSGCVGSFVAVWALSSYGGVGAVLQLWWMGLFLWLVVELGVLEQGLSSCGSVSSALLK